MRAAPTTDADILGHLAPGESAELVRTAGSWREIVFGSRTGWVASSYTRVVSTPAQPAAAEVSIRLGGWNIKKLGHGENTDYALLREIIEENFDLLVVVEVMQKQGGHPGYDRLMTELGPEWTGFVTDSPRPATSSSNSEFYAVIWRIASTVRPCDGWAGLRYQVDNDGGSTGSGPNLFSRDPAFACFAFGPADAPVADFVLAAFHATFQNDSAINAEFQRLTDVFAAMEAARPGERDHVIVGDFNRTSRQLATLLPQFADRTIGSGSTLNQSGAVTANLYDHVLGRDRAATTEINADAVVLDVRTKASSALEFFKTISDHLPIVMTLRASTDDN